MERKINMRKNEREIFKKRSPLQRLNGLQIRKPKKTSNASSSTSYTASVAFEVSNGCSRLLLSSNPSSTSSSSRTHFHRRPNNSSTVTLKARSNENELPKKPFSQKPVKNQTPHLDKQQYGKANTKAAIKNTQRSKLCSGRIDPVKTFRKRSEEIESKLKNSQDNASGEPNINIFGVYSDIIDLDCIEKCTPERKIASVSVSDSVCFDYSHNVKEDSISETDDGKNSNSAVRTPPVEASVSPEILCGPHSKSLVTKSAATPVCYGAGHLLSGVTDKRKCRRRGTLEGGCERINLFDDEKNKENVTSDSWDSLIPLPSEALVRWALSPCEEAGEGSKCKLDHQCRMIGEILLSSPSKLCGNVTGFWRDNSNQKMHEQEHDVMHDVIENNSAFSIDSLSSGNIIQTPSSDSGSYRYGYLGGSNVDLLQFELDSVTKTLDKIGLSSPSISLSQVQENVNSVCSWVSGSTLLENLALSQTKVSWKDGLISRSDENDEFDCCQCFSDEEPNDGVCFGKEKDLAQKSFLSSHLGTESAENKENGMQIYSVYPRGKGKNSPRGIDASAESICTNGGDLVASGDSDWMYFRGK
ncbi:hypothetical protein OROMI_006421 [Orobanche minor]